MAARRITIDGQTIDGTDEFGIWKVGSLDGWWAAPEAKTESIERPQSDGEYDLPVYYGARFVTATGSLKASSPDALSTAMNYFTGLLAKPGRLVVAGFGPTLWAEARRASGFSIDARTDRYAQWQIRMKCPDPRKFGGTHPFTVATGAPADVSHRGNYQATPRFTAITGAMPGGYTLTVDGWDYQVTVPLLVGTPHTVDYNDGRLRINGAIQQNSVGNTNLATIPPGRKVAVGLYPRTTGTGKAVLEVQDTYI